MQLGSALQPGERLGRHERAALRELREKGLHLLGDTPLPFQRGGGPDAPAPVRVGFAWKRGKALGGGVASGRSMGDAVSFLFRYLHIVSGVLWVGGAGLWTMIIAPNVLRRGPPAIRRPFLEAVLGKVASFFTIAAVLTILSGFLLLGSIVGWANVVDTFEAGAYGMALTLGIVLALAMLALGLAVVQPTGRKLLATMQTINGPPTPEQQATLAGLGKKVGIAGMMTFVLGFAALGAMAWAVNVVR